MTFSNTIAQWLAAEGIPVVYASNINLNCNVPVYMPGPGINVNFSDVGAKVGPRAGYLRIKSNITKLNCNIKVGVITATDGTNTTNIYDGDPASNANSLFYDRTFFFWFDWPVSNINITNIATTNNAATFDVEVAGIQ